MIFGRSFIICAFFTRGIYEDVFYKYLSPCLNFLNLKYNIPFHIECIDSGKDWYKNTRLKASFALDCLNRFPGKNIVLVDVDARIHEYPKLFENIPNKYILGAHFLCHEQWYRNGSKRKELLTGTFYIQNCVEARFLVKEWIRECNISSSHDQDCLETVLNKLYPNIYEKVYNIPIEYCYINSLPGGNKPHVLCEKPIVEHHQVSRSTKYLRN